MGSGWIVRFGGLGLVLIRLFGGGIGEVFVRLCGGWFLVFQPL